MKQLFSLFIVVLLLSALVTAQTTAWLSGSKIDPGTSAIFQSGALETSGSLLTLGFANSPTVQLAPPITLNNPFGNSGEGFTYVARYNPSTGVPSFAKPIDCGVGLLTIPNAGGFVTYCPFQSNGFAIDFVRYDASANFIWRRTFSYSEQNAVFIPRRFFFIDPTNPGFFYAVGGFRGTLNWGAFSVSSLGEFDVFVAKFSVETGDIVWLQSFGNAFNTFPGEVKVKPNGNIIVYFTSSNSISFNSGSLSIFSLSIGLLEFSSSTGAVVNFGSVPLGIIPNPTAFFNIENVFVDNALSTIWLEGTLSGGPVFFPAGVTLVPSGSNDRFVAQYTTSGIFHFAKLVASNAQNIRTNAVLDPVLNQFYSFYTIAGSTFFPDAGITVVGRSYFLEAFGTNGQLIFFKQSNTFVQSDPSDIIFFDNALYVFGYVIGTLQLDTRSVGGPTTPPTFVGFVGKIITKKLDNCVTDCPNCCKDVVIGSVCFDSNTHKCAAAVSLCGKFDETCGTVCYNPTTHICNAVNFLEPKP